MKFLLIIPDGMADHPQKALGNKTPLEVAHTPHMDTLARFGEIGQVETIPPGYPPGSDVAILNLFGYDPTRYYTGRSPLEAASIGVKLNASDVTFRCNLVSLSQNDEGNLCMKDYSAGHIPTDQAEEIINTINYALGSTTIQFYPGTSYRHLMVWKEGIDQVQLTPPHDIIGKEIHPYLPSGEGGVLLKELIEKSQSILKKHPTNIKRAFNKQPFVDSIWFWGAGKAPDLPLFSTHFGIQAAVISAVDLVKGIGLYVGAQIIEVPGATGYFDTNYRGKADAALEVLKNVDFVVVHIESPDEAGHMGDIKAKIEAIESIDQKIVGPLLNGIKQFGDYRILLTPDHPTPVELKTHVGEPVPFALYTSNDLRRKQDTGRVYSEVAAKHSGRTISKGHYLMPLLFNLPS